jgi:uncharacterized protein YjgD (DUF1641 family)
MAKPVTIFPKLRSEREELLSKLSDAPVEHAAALLDLYELVQVLHERGTLDLLRGFSGASNDIIGRLSEAMSRPESIRATRNLIEMAKLLAEIDPEGLRRTLDQGGKFITREQIAQSDPPGLWSIFRRMMSRDARRALSFFAEALNEVGRGISRAGVDRSHNIDRDTSSDESVRRDHVA